MIIKVVKHKLFNIGSIALMFLLLGWGISSVADVDIKSATDNFSAIGLVSEISDKNLKIIEAKGSDKSGETSFDLNIDNLEKIQTNKNELIDLIDIKKGDRIIVQGLTDGSTIFIKRIISFSTVFELATTTATTTDASTATTTASTTELLYEQSTPTPTSATTTTSIEYVDMSTSSLADVHIATDLDISTTTIVATMATTTSTTTVMAIPTIIENIVEALIDVIENIVNSLTGSTSNSTEGIIETQTVDIVTDQLMENTETDTLNINVAE